MDDFDDMSLGRSIDLTRLVELTNNDLDVRLWDALWSLRRTIVKGLVTYE